MDRTDTDPSDALIERSLAHLGRRDGRGGRPVGQVRLRYEDPVEDPVATLRPVVGPGADRILDEGSAQERHAVAGNPARFDRRGIVSDQRWRTGLGTEARVLAGTLTAPLLVPLRLSPLNVAIQLLCAPMPSASNTNTPRRSRALPVVVAAALAFGGCSGGDDDAEGDSQDPTTLLQEGVDAHLAGDLEAAERRYQRLVEVDPGNAVGHYNLGVVAHNESQHDEAETHYRRALDTDAGLTPAAFNLAILRAEAEDFEEAAALYKQVNELQPDNAGAHLNLSLVLEELGRADEAQIELARAAQLDPALAPNLENASAEEATTTTAGE